MWFPHKVKMAVWQDEETIRLLDLWSEESIQALLEGCTRNKTIYDKLPEDLAGFGYNQTGGQCLEHIKKLKKDFQRITSTRQGTVIIGSNASFSIS